MAADKDTRRATDLADPSAALVSYLDDLLQTATTAAKAEVTARPVVEAEPVIAPAPALASVEPRPVVEPPAVEIAAPEPQLATPAPQPEPAGPPAWASGPFECLIFRVAGLQLAVPLVLLGAIHRIEDRIKPIPGRPPWYMGMLPERGLNLKVVDTARWIMPERAPDNAHEQYRFVIRLDDSDWALACDSVAESFTLDPDQVRWRTSRSKRPWLAGTVVQRMCALIDVGTMASLLAQAEKHQHLDLG